jgi:hypothetical protein
MSESIHYGKTKHDIQKENEENKFIELKLSDLKNNSYRPGLHFRKKVLTIIACHTDNELRYNTTMNNLNYIQFINNDIVIVNSKGSSYSNKLCESVKDVAKAYIEIPNDSCLDIGKWCRGLHEYDYTGYDYVVFINDSIIIQNSIRHFYNKMIRKNLELYGYTDSSLITYHYQSYLFGVRKDAVMKLVSHFLIKKPILKKYIDVVHNIELQLTKIFQTKDCFLKIAHLKFNYGKNVFLSNPQFYNKLFSSGLLPLIKLKQLGSGA